jgi:hypothetical protein
MGQVVNAQGTGNVAVGLSVANLLAMNEMPLSVGPVAALPRTDQAFKRGVFVTSHGIFVPTNQPSASRANLPKPSLIGLKLGVENLVVVLSQVLGPKCEDVVCEQQEFCVEGFGAFHC